MKADMDILDAGLAAAEKLCLSLRTFKQIVGDIVSLDDEAQRAKADAVAAQKSLADITQQVAVAQTALENLRGEREQTEKQVAALRSERTELDGAIARIRALLKDAA
jgi:uncharacterized protein (DUF3084 family)